MTMGELTTFLGWCAVINYAVLLFSTLFIMACRNWTMNVHRKFFPLMSDAALQKAYFDYLGQYKILIIVFNIVPWIALKIMA